MSLFIATLSALFAVFSWFAATATNKENRPIQKGWRWVHLLTLPIIGMSLVYFIAEILSMPHPVPLVLSIFGMVPGLWTLLKQPRTVPDKTVQVVQNTLWPQKARSGLPLRLFATAGVIPLLPGEVIRESFTIIMEPMQLPIRNVETKDGSPLNTTVTYQVAVDMTRFQQVLELNQDESKWWAGITAVLRGLLTSLVSDVIKRENAKSVVSKTDKTEMSEKLSEGSPLKRDGGFFPEGKRLGFQLVDVRFDDIDYTEAVKSANEQKLKMAIYSQVAKGMKRLIPKFDELTAQEQADVVSQAMTDVLSSDGKVKQIAIKRLGMRGGGEGSNVLEDLTVANELDNTPKKGRK